MTASVGLSSRALQFGHRCTSNITLLVFCGETTNECLTIQQGEGAFSKY